MKGSAFKSGGVQGTSGHSSALKQTNRPHQKRNPDDERYENVAINPNYATTNNQVSKNGKTFQKTKNSDFSGDGERRYISDNFGNIGQLSKKELREARMSYFDLMNKPVVDTSPSQVMPVEREKYKSYPTNKLTEDSGADIELMDKTRGEEVWDPTLNEGKGGYIRKKKMGDSGGVIPEFKGTIVDPLADKPY